MTLSSIGGMVQNASSNRVVSGRNPALELPISFIIS